MLELQGIVAGYAGSTVLQGIDLDVAGGQVVSLMGRNGMGKTTTVRAIFGLIRPMAGRVLIDGRNMTGAPPHAIARTGLGLVPEGRQIFPNLTVAENLVATARPGPWSLPTVFGLFPRLADRRHHGGNQLSGGEQQMLAIGRALMTNPRLLVLDEATEGLAPLVRAEIWDCLSRLRADGMSILVIDKDLSALSRLADHHLIIDKGRIVWQGDSAALNAATEARERWLHV